jgi:hypothetical protein
MKEFKFGGVRLVFSEAVSECEARAYYDRAYEQYGAQLRSVCVVFDGDYAGIDCAVHAHPFERIRRITGYLVGTLDRFNEAKRAEERDRVKHAVKGAK